MSLRSGLLMESTWALDILNVLLYDDNAFTYFGLGNMPGLFEALLEHWKISLGAMFGLTEDLDPVKKPEEKRRGKEGEQKRKWWERSQGEGEEEEKERNFYLGQPRKVEPAAKLRVLSGQDYTKKGRFGDDGFFVDDRDDALFVDDESEREWDKSGEGMNELCSDHWRVGGGNSKDHIIPTLAANLGLVNFVRVLKEERNRLSKAEEPVAVKKEPAEESEANDHEVAKGDRGEEDPVKKEGNRDEEEEPKEDIVDRIRRLTGIVLRDPDAARKRWREESLEEECYVRDEPSLHLVTESHENMGKRAMCISTILRNLSFMPGNEYEFARSAAFLSVAGRLLLLHHWYPARSPSRQRNYDRNNAAGESPEDGSNESSSASVNGKSSATAPADSSDAEWWWDYLNVIRENVMVTLANVSGALEMRQYDECIVRPILAGLMQWAVSSASHAQDPFSSVGPHSPVSPQRLAIEALCKLCVHETNVDLLLSTPPFYRIERLVKLLSRWLYRYEDQVLREFAINLLYYLSGADSGAARVIAMVADNTVGLLLGFVEQAEQNALVVAQQHGVNALRDNPESMGTSLDMLRRAASTLLNLGRHQDNLPLFAKHEQRLLSLVMSQILDQGVAAILSNVLYHIGSEQEHLQRAYLAKLAAVTAGKAEKDSSSNEETAEEEKSAAAEDCVKKENGVLTPNPAESVVQNGTESGSDDSESTGPAAPSAKAVTDVCTNEAPPDTTTTPTKAPPPAPPSGAVSTVA